MQGFFGALGDKLAHIEWGKSPTENVAILKRIVQQVCEDLYDNGQPGLISRVEAHMSEAIGASLEQARQHKANSLKLNIIMALAAVMALVISAVGIFVSIEISKHGIGQLHLHSSTYSVLANYYAQQ